MQQPWTWSAEITKYSPFNFEIENRNALGIYSSALYGYRNSLATAVANNSRYCELAFCNFEDMDLFGDMHGHLSLSFGSVHAGDGHSGKRSWQARSLNVGMNTKTDLSQANYDGKLTLQKGKKYIFSCWAKISEANTENYHIEKSYPFSVSVGGQQISPVVETPVEGWQRIEFEFEVPNTASETDFRIEVFPYSYIAVLFDDIRIHPYNAVVKSYVYDPSNYRLSAELDENNYATFYNYDEEGTLVQIKKETERGIFTIQTTRQHLKKNNATSMNP